MSSDRRGIELIQNACRADGFPEPQFQWDNGLWVVFPFVTLAEQKTTVETTVEKAKTPELVLKALSKNPTMTLAEIAEAIGKSVRAVERASVKLVTEGRLRHVGPRKGGHWEVL